MCWFVGQIERILHLFILYTLYILCTLLFFLHVYLYEGITTPERGVTDSFELSCWWWDLKQGPLEEQPVLLTDGPFLQPPRIFHLNNIKLVNRWIGDLILSIYIFLNSYKIFCSFQNNFWVCFDYIFPLNFMVSLIVVSM